MKIPALGFSTVLKTNQIGFARGSRKTGDLLDKIPGGFDTRVVRAPFSPQKSGGVGRAVTRTIADKFRVLQFAYPLDEGFDLLLFAGGQCLGGERRRAWRRQKQPGR